MKWVWRILGALLLILALAFIIFRTPDTNAAEMRAKYGGEPSQFVEIGDGVAVHLRDEGIGEGAPIILLHGSNADLHTWEPWTQGLKDSRRVIRFDQVGHGLTGPDPADDYSRANYASDVIEVANALGIDQFILGGNSMGGRHALAVASLYPDRVAGLILVNAGGAPRDEVEAMMDPAVVEADAKDSGGGNIGFAIARTPGVNLIAQHITPRSLIKQSLEQSVSNKAVVTEKAVDRYWEMLRYPGNRAATMARFSTEYKQLSSEEISAIAAPTLIIWGDEDGLIPVEAGQWFDQALTDSELIIYPQIGHLPHEEAVEASLADLKTWLVTQNSAKIEAPIQQPTP